MNKEESEKFISEKMLKFNKLFDEYSCKSCPNSTLIFTFKNGKKFSYCHNCKKSQEVK